MSYTGLLNQTIALKASTGFDGFGAGEPGTPVSYPARVEYENLEILDSEGRTKIARMRIFVAAAFPGVPQDTVTYSGEDWEIINVAEVWDRDTLHHKEVLI